jgi:hypothetical protein
MGDYLPLSRVRNPRSRDGVREKEARIIEYIFVLLAFLNGVLMIGRVTGGIYVRYAVPGSRG